MLSAAADATARTFSLVCTKLHAIRDEDANAAVDRARTFQREANDLRRKLETIASTTSTTFATHARATKATAATGRSDKTVRFSDEAIGNVDERRGSNERGGASQQQQQQQEREELEREVGRLRRELQEKREACAEAEADGDELQATVEEASCVWWHLSALR